MKNIFFFLLLAIPLVLNAQVQDTTIVINEVTVEVSRSTPKTAATVTNISSTQIRVNTFGQETPYILSTTPSITISSDAGSYSGYVYYRLRGIDQTRINVSLNGAPLNEPEDQGVYFSNFPDFINNIESVQIQRGIGTTQTGVSSFAGSINFESPLLFDKKTSTAFETSYGSFGTYRASFKTQGSVNNFGYYARFSKLGSDGYRNNSSFDGYSAFVSAGYVLKNDVIKFTSFTGSSKNQMAYLATSIDDIRIDPKTNYLNPNEDDDFSQTYSQLQYIDNVSSNFYTTTTLFYNTLKGDYDIGALNFRLSSDYLGVIYNGVLTGIKSKFSFGVQGDYYTRDHSLVEGVDRIYLNRGTNKSTVVFTKYDYQIRKFLIQGDIQYRAKTFQYTPMDGTILSTSNLEQKWNFVNFRAGVSYLTNNGKFYTTVGQTNREPARTDILGGNDNITEDALQELYPFDKVKPERVTDIEIGYEYKNKSTVLHVNTFYMGFKNEIAPIGGLSPITTLPLRTNVPSSYRTGVEVEASQRVFNALTYAANGTYMEANISQFGTFSNVRPLLTPKLIFNQSLTLDVKGIQLSVASRYNSNTFLDNTENSTLITPSFWVYDSRVAYVGKSFKVAVFVNNLLNKEYFTNGYAVEGTPYYYTNAGRNFVLTLSKVF
jgi:iron complex outermembrane recepter protein